VGFVGDDREALALQVGMGGDKAKSLLVRGSKDLAVTMVRTFCVPAVVTSA
jgi:hypothetical protein